jgi:hypothetical protein
MEERNSKVCKARMVKILKEENLKVYLEDIITMMKSNVTTNWKG